MENFSFTKYKLLELFYFYPKRDFTRLKDFI